MSGTPTMKVMLKDMFEFIDAVADIMDIEHDESLQKLQKKSNNQFLQFNIFMMMTIVKSLMEDKADAPCNHCHQELQEENEKLKESDKHLNECINSIRDQYLELKEEKESWQEGEFKLTKQLSEERTKIVELKEALKTGNKLLKESKEWNDKAVEEMTRMKEEIEKLKFFNRECKEETERVMEEHKKFDEIWKTEGITEQDIIDMKRQISDQCDLIKKLKIKLQNREEMMRDRIDERDTFKKSLRDAEQEVKKQKEIVIQLQKFQADENDAKDIRCVNKIAEEVEKNRELTRQNKYLKEEIERLK